MCGEGVVGDEEDDGDEVKDEEEDRREGAMEC